MLLPPQIKQNCLDEDGSNILAWVGVPDVYMCAPIHCCFHSLSPQTFCTFHVGMDSVRLVMGAICGDRCNIITSATSVDYPILAEFGGRVVDSEAWRVLVTG